MPHEESLLHCTNCEWKGKEWQCANWSECNEDRCVICRNTEQRFGDIHMWLHECPKCGETAAYPTLCRDQQETLRAIVEEMPEDLDVIEECGWLWHKFDMQGWDDIYMIEAIANYCADTPNQIPQLTLRIDDMWFQMKNAPTEEPEHDEEPWEARQ
jgi:hypothetical protein